VPSSTFSAALFIARRQAAGLSQGQLAALGDLPASLVAKIEQGECQPSLAALGSFAVALGCRTSELLDDSVTCTVLSELGAATDAWIERELATAPPMTDETARRVSAAMFPGSAVDARQWRDRTDSAQRRLEHYNATH
jgi:transcriptional regulator with XRE-family HTH domain